MDSLIHQFSQLTIATNFELVGQSDFRPHPPFQRFIAVENHKKTVLKAMSKYFYIHEVETVLQDKLRSDIQSIESIEKDFFDGDIPYHPLIRDDNYKRALANITERFRPPRKCRPTHIFDVQHHYPHKRSSNAEAPFSTQPFFKDQLPKDTKPTFGNMEDIIFKWTRHIIHNIKHDIDTFDDHLYYILLHNKSAIINADDPNKVRSISGFPRPQNIGFIQLFWSYMAWLKRHPGNTPLLWGYETILGGWLRLNYELSRSYIRTTIVTLDKSRFDKFYMFEIQDDIDNMFLNEFLDFDNGYVPTTAYDQTHLTWTPEKAARMRRLFLWLCYSFRNTPTVIHDGRMYRRKWFGMPSGVYTTQLYDTIHFGITNMTVLYDMGFSDQQILLYKGEGDDILFQLAVFIPPNMHQEFLTTYAQIDNQRFGSITRPEKCEVHNTPQGVQVLGYRNNRGLPKRDDIDLLAQLYHTKSLNPTPSKTMAMAVGISYASCGLSKRLYATCKDIFEYYESQGYTPDERTFSYTFYSDILTKPMINFKRFPKRIELLDHLLNFSYDSPETMERFFPRSHFLDDF
ncbi:RNA-dependent RNA polymerase [Leucocybe candicans partitivirus 1]|nr:RNA-dependent RNA polymerase [Leucocybe candicans partitivirus 1]